PTDLNGSFFPPPYSGEVRRGLTTLRTTDRHGRARTHRDEQLQRRGICQVTSPPSMKVRVRPCQSVVWNAEPPPGLPRVQGRKKAPGFGRVDQRSTPPPAPAAGGPRRGPRRGAPRRRRRRDPRGAGRR